MRILTRYLLRAHLGPFLFSLSVLTGLLLINTVARRLESLVGKGLSIQVILEVLVLSVPYTLALTFPMSVLVAVLYVFSQLSADNEIATLKASGVSLIRLIAPLLLVALVLTGGMIWFNDRVLPESNHRLRNLLVDISRKSPTLSLKEQVINEIRTGDFRTRYYLKAARIASATNRLFDVVIYDLSAQERDRTIYADSGRMAFNEARTDLYLTLYDGWIHERDRDEPERFFRMFFDQQIIRIADIGNQLERTMDAGNRGDREMTVAMLSAEVARRRTELAEVREESRKEMVKAVREALGTSDQDDSGAIAVTTAGGADSGHVVRQTPDPAPRRDPLVQRMVARLGTLETRARALQEGINRHRVELHKKYAIPFACIVFVLIGAPLAVRFPRGGVGMVIVFSLVIFSIYWMGLTGGEQLGDKGIVSPIWGMWSVNVVFFALGIRAFLRIGRETATTRGGGWDDLRDTIRAAAGRRLAVLRTRSAE